MKEDYQLAIFYPKKPCSILLLRNGGISSYEIIYFTTKNGKLISIFLEDGSFAFKDDAIGDKLSGKYCAENRDLDKLIRS